MVPWPNVCASPISWIPMLKSSQSMFLASELFGGFCLFVSVYLYFNWKLGVPYGKLGMMSSLLRSYLMIICRPY